MNVFHKLMVKDRVTGIELKIHSQHCGLKIIRMYNRIVNNLEKIFSEPVPLNFRYKRINFYGCIFHRAIRM
jgi:hypothetical protein